VSTDIYPFIKVFLVCFWIEDSGTRARAFLGAFTAYLVDLSFWQAKKSDRE
jgi:hypothetical protein